MKTYTDTLLEVLRGIHAGTIELLGFDSVGVPIIREVNGS